MHAWVVKGPDSIEGKKNRFVKPVKQLIGLNSQVRT